MRDVRQRLEAAIGKHQAGDLAAAESGYRELLADEPACVDAMHLLGVLCHQTGRRDEARPLFLRALQLNPARADVHFSLSVSLGEQGQRAEAIQCLRRAVALKPTLREAQFNLGNLLRQESRWEEAAAAYRAALRCDANYFKALANLGRTLLDLGDYQEALTVLRRAAELQPANANTQANLREALERAQRSPAPATGNRFSVVCTSAADLAAAQTLRQQAERDVAQGRLDAAATALVELLARDPQNSRTRVDLGNVLRGLGHYAEAKAMFDIVLETEPRNIAALNGLGIAYRSGGELEEALACHLRAIELGPQVSESQRRLGWVYADLDRPQEALAAFLAAERCEPDSAVVKHSLGTAWAELGRWDEAVACYQEGLRLAPDFAPNRLGLAHCALLNGDFEAGWANYESRWKCPWVPAAAVPHAAFSLPLWQGEPRTGQTILLHAEQGLGDTLQFIRYVPAVRARSGADVVVRCGARLIPLLRNAVGCQQLVATDAPPCHADAQATLMSLPWVLGTQLSSIPAQVPYIFADAARIARWRDRLAALPGVKVGIAWQGSPTYRGDRRRSTRLENFAPLAGIPGVRLISLQQGFGTEQLADVAQRFPVTTLDEELDRDGAFVDTAAIMKCLDLVISIDTAIPHLAGALGVEAWLLLPHVAEWRWLRARADSPWYPTLRLFRQPTYGDWPSVFAAVAASLAERLQASGASGEAPGRDSPGPSQTSGNS